MASSTLIIDYLGEGTLASRPAAPVLPTGGLGFYFATDTSQLFLYDVGGAVWILVANPGSAATSRALTATGNTTGATSSTTAVLSAVTFSGAGAASVGFTGGTIVVSVPVAAGTVGNLFAGGHTTGATSSTTNTLSNLSFEGDGGVSVGFSTTAAGAGVVVISGATTAASGTVQNISILGNTTGATTSFADTLSARTISAVGGASAGFDTNGVLLVSANAGAGGATTNDYFALGNTTAATSSATASNSAISISGAGAVSVGLSTTAAGADVWIVSSPATVASGTVQNITVLGNTTAATSSFADTLSAQSISGAGGASVGFDTNGVLIVSGATTAASATAQNLFALGNTTGATSSTTVTLTGFSFSGAAGASVGFSTTGAGAGVVIVSGATGGGTGGATTQDYFALGNTTGATSSATASNSAISFSGAGGVSVGMTTTAAGAEVIVISGATGGGGGGTISYTEVPGPMTFGTGAFIGQNATFMLVEPFSLASAVAMNRVRLPIIIDSINDFFISESLSSNASRSLSATYSVGWSVIFYSSTAYNAWVSAAMASTGLSATNTLSESGSSWTQFCSVVYPIGGTTASTTVSTTVITSNPLIFFKNMFAANFQLQSAREVELGLTTTLAANNLWMAGIITTSAGGSTGAGAGTTRLTSPIVVHSYLGVPILEQSYLPLFLPMVLSNNTVPIGLTGAIVTSLSAGFNASDMNQQAARNQFYFSMGSFTS